MDAETFDHVLDKLDKALEEYHREYVRVAGHDPDYRPTFLLEKLQEQGLTIALQPESDTAALETRSSEHTVTVSPTFEEVGGGTVTLSRRQEEDSE